MIPIPFLIGAAIGAGVTLYLKKSDRGQTIVNTFSDSVKSGAETVSDAATTTVDTVKSTVETIKEKTADKKAARKKTTNDDEK